ncbi:hypothetical protein HNY73_017144 [Argiope bruennichi]|uniref:Gustatory receptor n=1 Tax=Argiope bruennichi TaxID=94029 RepID=A0A8T0EKV1_ARGBR|nr:hypothetical protein HNY73_017144 [Argiope bruennichi]
MTVPMYTSSSEAKEVTLGFAVAAVFPLLLQHGINFKKHLMEHILDQYHRIDVLLMNHVTIKSTRKINLAITSILLTVLLAAFFSALTLPRSSALIRYYSFFTEFKDEVIEFVTPFCTMQLVFAYQYTYPCIIAVTCGVLYYEFGDFLLQFHFKNLDDPAALSDRNKILSIAKIHALLFEVAHEVRDATSVICFLLLCFQTTTLYCSLAMFLLMKKEDFTIPQIIESCLVVTLIPASIIGVVYGASRISHVCQKIEMSLLLTRDKLSRQCVSNQDSIRFLDLMITKKLPRMTAFGLGELTPNFVLSMFGSLFTYSLLVLNLQK